METSCFSTFKRGKKLCPHKYLSELGILSIPHQGFQRWYTRRCHILGGTREIHKIPRLDFDETCGKDSQGQYGRLSFDGIHFFPYVGEGGVRHKAT